MRNIKYNNMGTDLNLQELKTSLIELKVDLEVIQYANEDSELAERIQKALNKLNDII